MARRRRGAVLAAAYGVPLLCAALLVGFYYSRSRVKYPELSGAMRAKHTVNMGQVYAFGYHQRHPEWTESPWVGYPQLMRRDFGAEEVSLTEMLRRNPRAYLTHATWNLRLTPAGLQMMLFNGTTAEMTPDYAPLKREPARAAWLSAAVLLAVIAGGLLAWRRWRFWRRAWFGPRAHGWLVMACVASTALLVIPTQRPRPSYLFTLSLLLMALVGAGVFVICRTLTGRRSMRPVVQRLPLAMPLVMLAVILLALNPYRAAHKLARSQNQRVPQPLLEVYERLLPYQNLLARDATVFLVDPYPGEMYYVLQRGKGSTQTTALLDQMRPDESLAAFLERSRVNVLYLDLHTSTRLEQRRVGMVSEFLRAAPAAGWELGGAGGPPWSRWVLLWKPREPAGPPQGDFLALSPLLSVPRR